MKLKEKFVKAKDACVNFAVDHIDRIVCIGCTAVFLGFTTVISYETYKYGRNEGIEVGNKYGQSLLSYAIRKDIPEAAEVIDDYFENELGLPRDENKKGWIYKMD